MFRVGRSASAVVLLHVQAGFVLLPVGPHWIVQLPEHGLNRLSERLLLFRHDYNSENILLPINAASDVAEGTLVEIVVSGK